MSELKWISLDLVEDSLLNDGIDSKEVSNYIGRMKNDIRFKDAGLVNKYNALMYLWSDMEDLVKDYPELKMNCQSEYICYNDEMLWGAWETDEYDFIDVEEDKYYGLYLDVEQLIIELSEDNPLLADYCIYLLRIDRSISDRLYNSNDFMQELELIKNEDLKGFEDYKINKERFLELAKRLDNIFENAFIEHDVNLCMEKASDSFSNKSLYMELRKFLCNSKNNLMMLIDYDEEWNFSIVTSNKTYNMLDVSDIIDFKDDKSIRKFIKDDFMKIAKELNNFNKELD